MKFIYLIVFISALSSCSSGVNINLFSIKDDKDFGLKVSQEIESDPKFKILDSLKYKEVYTYVNKIRDEILNSGKVKHKNDFDWKIKIMLVEYHQRASLV